MHQWNLSLLKRSVADPSLERGVLLLVAITICFRFPNEAIIHYSSSPPRRHIHNHAVPATSVGMPGNTLWTCSAVGAVNRQARYNRQHNSTFPMNYRVAYGLPLLSMSVEPASFACHAKETPTLRRQPPTCFRRRRTATGLR